MHVKGQRSGGSGREPESRNHIPRPSQPVSAGRREGKRQEEGGGEEEEGGGGGG